MKSASQSRPASGKVAIPTEQVTLSGPIGVWNVVAVNQADLPDSTYQAVLGLKVAVVAASGITAWRHTRATTPRGLAVWGALTGLTALSALFLGVLLAG